jgi:hypothetical protein
MECSEDLQNTLQPRSGLMSKSLELKNGEEPFNLVTKQNTNFAFFL